MKEEKTPQFQIKIDKCPYCNSQDIGLMVQYSGPSEYHNNPAMINAGVIKCKDCGRSWSFNILTSIQERD